MDREQEELQFLGFFGICSESIKIISTWRKMFLQITLTLIFPLSFVFLFNTGVSILLAGKILHNEDTLDRTREGTVAYNKLANALSSEWTEYMLIKVVYFTFLLIFSLLSTSAVVYTIACAYSGKEITYKKVMSVVPKVWKRLMVTFLCNFAILVVYNICAFFIVFALLLILWDGREEPTTILRAFLIFYFIGFVYISVIWHLASVISVLEESFGFQAMTKSKALIKGKMAVSVVMFVLFNFILGWIQVLFEKHVVFEQSVGVIGLIGFGGLSMVLLSMLFLFGFVVQTIIYFVCKSYHHENIDKSLLADHLGGYLGEYIPLTTKDIQMEQI